MKSTDQISEFWRTRREWPPRILYKFRSMKKAKQILLDKKVWWSSPLDFNDPFDSQWNIMWPIYTAEHEFRFRLAMREVLLGGAALSPRANPEYVKAVNIERSRLLAMSPLEREASLEETASEILENGRRTDARMERERISDIKLRTRVWCLCEPRECTLMWSHYGDQHQGVAIGFDLARLEVGWNRPFERVVYSDALPRLINADAWLLHLVFGHDKPDWTSERDWALFKNKAWSYEREWRVVSIEPKGTTTRGCAVALPEHAIAEVVFGCRADSGLRKGIEWLAKENSPNCRFVQLREARDSFRLVLDSDSSSSVLHSPTRTDS